MTPFRNNDNFLNSTRLLSDGCLSTIIDASMFCLIHLSNESGRRHFQVTEWIGLFFRCRFWIFLCIFMFLPPNFNFSYSLTNVSSLTRTYTFLNHTWWMRISTFQLKVFSVVNINFEYQLWACFRWLVLDIRINWITKKVKQLFKLKSRNLNPSCVI